MNVLKYSQQKPKYKNRTKPAGRQKRLSAIRLECWSGAR